ncbi:MAG: hypothetical protein H0W73_12170 [Bacteroidetes bacterium]|nr:hypothetical protein [Bacteroidota bacterium]
MDLSKILRIFYTAWLIIFAIVFLTHCKSNPNQMHENIAIDNSIDILPENPVKATDSALTQPSTETPVTTSVAVTNTEAKPVKLIYLK